MSDIQVVEPAKSYLLTHKKAIREVVQAFASPKQLEAWDHALACMDGAILSNIMNVAWFNAPDKRDVYQIPGFTEMCHLLDETVEGLHGPSRDLTTDADEETLFEEDSLHADETQGIPSHLRPYGLVIPEIPLGWRHILNQVQRAFPTATMGGGCLRDLILGVSPKDIDIVISKDDMPEGQEFSMIPLKDGLDNFNLKRLQADLQSYDLSFSDVIDVWEGSAASEDGEYLKIQIILVSGPSNLHSVAERCDFGICRIAYNGTQLFIHKDFIHDYSTKTCTLRRCKYPLSHKRRWDRFQSRPEFSGYKLVAPQIERWEAEQQSQNDFDDLAF